MHLTRICGWYVDRGNAVSGLHPLYTRLLGDRNHMDGSAAYMPAWLRDLGLAGGPDQRRPNLTVTAQAYIDKLGLSVEDLFYHALWVLHNPALSWVQRGGTTNGVAPHTSAGLARW